MKRIATLILTITICCIVIVASASELLVMGRVVDANSGPIEWTNIVGATVTIKNSTDGSITNSQGLYIIRAETSDTLVFSAIGYQTQEVPVYGRTIINVFLEPEF